MIKDAIGADVMVTEIDRSVVKRFRQKRDQTISEKTKRKLSRVTINGELAELQRVLRHARDDHEIPCMPVINWGDIRHSKASLPTRTRTLTPDECVLVLERIRADYRPIIEFALSTGLRLQNLVGLTWAEVNLHYLTLNIIQKGGRVHVVPITEDVVDILNGEVSHCAGPRSNVFTYVAERTRANPKTGAPEIRGQRYPITYSGLESYWSSFVASLGISHIMLHDLRRTCTTDFVLATSLELGSKFVGHSDTKVTESVYTIIPRPQIVEAARITAEVRRANRLAARQRLAEGVLEVSGSSKSVRVSARKRQRKQ